MDNSNSAHYHKSMDNSNCAQFSDSKSYNRVYVDMVGDLFHYGHVNILRRAKEIGRHLIVGVHDDETVATYKRVPIMTMKERIAVIEVCKYVDYVIPNAPLHITEEYLNFHEIDLVIAGNDHNEEENKIMYEIPIKYNKFINLPYTKSINTSEIIQRLKNADRVSNMI